MSLPSPISPESNASDSLGPDDTYLPSPPGLFSPSPSLEYPASPTKLPSSPPELALNPPYPTDSVPLSMSTMEPDHTRAPTHRTRVVPLPACTAILPPVVASQAFGSTDGWPVSFARAHSLESSTRLQAADGGQLKKRRRSILLSYECHPIHRAALLASDAAGAAPFSGGNPIAVGSRTAQSCPSKPKLTRLVVPGSDSSQPYLLSDAGASHRSLKPNQGHPYSAYASTSHTFALPYPTTHRRTHLPPTIGRPRAQSLNLNPCTSLSPGYIAPGSDLLSLDSPHGLRERRQVHLQIDFPNSAMARFRRSPTGIAAVPAGPGSGSTVSSATTCRRANSSASGTVSASARSGTSTSASESSSISTPVSEPRDTVTPPLLFAPLLNPYCPEPGVAASATAASMGMEVANGSVVRRVEEDMKMDVNRDSPLRSATGREGKVTQNPLAMNVCPPPVVAMAMDDDEADHLFSEFISL